ncbi:MAG: response regulator [Candidatus Manganitrophus sp.]|jgi:two-component system KDP operon response regulator KdpE|nr:response regulator [Candidatus Manganitrophus morganii]MDC4205953.1 response regulator [Candidatus Manganitrophus sp.]WDT72225.1 MAG: response regulator [Candidatus Manganitrophus sp.]WDT75530.1 MAG: response regulator [Candidatus Manganitrophus sp.]
MTTSQPTILVIEDETPIGHFIQTTLSGAGYRVVDAETGKEGLTQAMAWNPDVVLLDLGLPDIDGLEVIRRLREWTSKPIIVLTARSQEHDKVTALDLGADDYLTKPFGIEELLARMRVALRRTARTEAGEPLFQIGDLRVDLEKRRVFIAGKEVHLSPTEYKLLGVLVRHAGKVITHRQLLKEVWGPLHAEEAQYLRVYMRQLRGKLEENPSRPRYLLTEIGVGYRLRVD